MEVTEKPVCIDVCLFYFQIINRISSLRQGTVCCISAEAEIDPSVSGDSSFKENIGTFFTTDVGYSKTLNGITIIDTFVFLVLNSDAYNKK